MKKNCKQVFERAWFRYIMRLSVFGMNLDAWYLVNHVLIEFWINESDKMVVKTFINILAIFMMASYVTAFMKSPTKIPE